jgi:adenine-specific DNA-methyltransferase
MTNISYQPSFLAGKAPEIKSKYEPEARAVITKGDCLNSLRKLPDGFAQLIITSPPYNIGKVYEKATSLEEYLRVLDPVIDELVRVLSDKGSICWQVGNYIENAEVYPLDIFYYSLFKKHNLQLRNRIIWYFEHGLHASKRLSGRYETMLWFTKTDGYLFDLDQIRVPQKYKGKTNFKLNHPDYGKPTGNPLGKNPSDIWKLVSHDWETALWNIPNVKANHPEKTIHPCQFPIELVERCVLALSREDDWILDPFSGVGSAMLAALKNNRRAMGLEKEQEYVKLSRQRIKDLFSGKLRYRTLGKPVHQPTGREKVAQTPQEWLLNGEGK